jgi:Rieske Fe-S protein
LLSALVERMEAEVVLDRTGAPLKCRATPAVTSRAVCGCFVGQALGHPAHPALVSATIGCWTGAQVADLAGEPRAGRLLTGLGVLSALPVAATGASDWADTTGAEQRVGVVHLGANLTTTAFYAGSWWARRRGRQRLGVALGMAGALLATAAGWLGGHPAYAVGVGVDTNAFDGGPTEWTSVDKNSGDPAQVIGGSAGVGLAIVRPSGVSEGPSRQPGVLANRCSHRGGPLADGDLIAGCLRCPWHGSEFDLATGQVRRGPATRPQPVYEVRMQNGDLQVRRDEPRSLRIDPVRP